MADIKLAFDEAARAGDLVYHAGALDTDDTLDTAILQSIFSDARARDDDALPDGETSRRGWWGDGVADVEGDRFGSRLWLLCREKQTEATRQKAVAYVKEALAWLTADGVATAVDVDAAWTARGVLTIYVACRLANGKTHHQSHDYGMGS
ncbi:phage GP46 family protein [Desulfarculus baarsii]